MKLDGVTAYLLSVVLNIITLLYRSLVQTTLPFYFVKKQALHIFN